MSRKRPWSGISVVFLTCIVPSLLSGADISNALDQARGQESLQVTNKSTEFSARLTWRRQGKTFKAQLFVKGDRYRIEYLGGVKTELGIAGLTIVRGDKRKVWYIYSQRRLVLSVPVTEMDLLPTSVILDGEIRRTFIGDAVVGTRSALLYEVEVQRQSGHSEKYYEWVDVERQVLLKLLSQDQDWWVEYDHLVLSNQPDYFFDPPLGYRTVEAQEAVPLKK